MDHSGAGPGAEAAFLSGSATVRGYPYQRFAGDALLYGGVELRTFLTRARLVLNGDLGVLAFGDAGRVYFEGSSEGGWHTGYGGGLWFETLGSTASISYARGERSVVYLKLGLPF